MPDFAQDHNEHEKNRKLLPPAPKWADRRSFLIWTVAGCALFSVQETLGSQAPAIPGARLFGLPQGEQRAQTLLQELDRLLSEVRRRRLPAAYQEVTYHVAKMFLTFVRQDENWGRLAHASTELKDAEFMTQAAIEQLRNILHGRAPALPVPTPRMAPVTIRGDAFWTRVLDGASRTEMAGFFSGYGYSTQARDAINRYPGLVAHIMQTGTGPLQTLFPAPGKVNRGVLRGLRQLLRQAVQYNVGIDLIAMGGHTLPDWYEKAHPEVTHCRGEYVPFDIDAPATRRFLARYFQLLMKNFAGASHLFSVCISNEPDYRTSESSPYTLDKWKAWLQRTHGTVIRLNRAYGSSYRDFAEVPPFGATPGRGPRFYDWCIFNQERFAAYQAWLARQVHRRARRLPVHAKISQLRFFDRGQMVGWGVDPELICRVTQIAGNDGGSSYLGPGHRWAADWQQTNLWNDLLFALSHKPLYNSENHIINDATLARVPVPAEHVRTALWQAAIHGQRATTIWAWDRSNQIDGFGYNSALTRPDCVLAISQNALDLQRLGREVLAFCATPRRVHLLYSMTSMIWSQAYVSAWLAAYEALSLGGLDIGFISERQLAAGIPRDLEFLVAPQADYVQDAAARTIMQFARRGGRVVLLGNAALEHDQYGKIRTWRRQILKQANVGNIPSFVPGKTLRRQLLAQAAHAGIRPAVILEDAAEGGMAWGVEWRSATLGARQLINAVNYLSAPVTVRLASGGRFKNLLEERPVGATLELQPLHPALLERI